MNAETEILAEIKPYNTKELAQLYGIGKDAMSSWLGKVRDKLLDKQLGRYWNVRQVQIIFDHFGHPRINNKPQK